MSNGQLVRADRQLTTCHLHKSPNRLSRNLCGYELSCYFIPPDMVFSCKFFLIAQICIRISGQDYPVLQLE